MSHPEHPSTFRRWLLGTAALLAVVLPASAHAEDQKPDSSLGLIPADAAFYSAMLRNREQLDAVLHSKTWARLSKLEGFQLAQGMVKGMINGATESNPAFKQWMEKEENRDLLALLTDAVSTEMFCYGGGNWVDFIDLMQQMYKGMQLGPYAQAIKTGKPVNPQDAQVNMGRSLLRVLARNPKKMRVPDFVVGFKIKDAKKAESQLKRLEALVNLLVAMEPMMEGRFKRVEIGGGSFLTLNLDGGMVPWEQIDLKQFEEAAGEFDGVIKNLKRMTLTISLGVRDDFLLFAIGSATDGIKNLGGEGARLTSRAELKPLVRAGSKRFTSISYTSKALDAKSRMTARDIDGYVTMADQAMEAAGLAEAQRKAIMKDVAGLGDDLKKNLTVPGASLSYTYLSERGYDSFEYQYGEFPDRDSTQALTLLDHLGGDPILATVGRTKGTLRSYLTLAKWIKIAYGHVEPLMLEKMREDEKKKYEEGGKLIFPLLKRFDEITSKLLLPSLADGQAGFVLDVKWKSKRWHPALPVSDQPLPMPELAFLLGVSDADQLEKAVKSYGKLIEDALELAKQNAPPKDAPPFTKLPEPEVKTIKAGKLYLWRLPEQAQLDPRIAVTAGLSEKVAVLALSADHAERLLTRKPLKVEGGPLADTKRHLTGATYFNWPAFIDSLSPWVRFGIEQVPLDKGLVGDGDKKDEAEQKKLRAKVVQHTRAVLDALKAIRISTSATYIEEGALITHSEVVIRDE